MTKVVITFGTFDVFHVGHLRILQRAKSMGDRLVVGVSTDELTLQKKGRFPIYSAPERVEIVDALKYVDEVFLEETLEEKRDYIQYFGASLLVMGDDWSGRFDSVTDLCEVAYLTRTPSVSTTELIEKIRIK